MFRHSILLTIGISLLGSEGIAGEKWWAFSPPVKPDVPVVSIDRLLESKGEPPSADLEKHQLIRRAYFDLHGLPPRPEQIDAFLGDTSPDAFESVVDELLASPRFGERWGRHWLDVARFSESTGGGRTMLLKHSWRYRDYVIDAFNRDKPYDRFVTEQIAGDLLPDTDAVVRRDNLIATTFLALGPSNYELQDKELLRMEIIDEQVDTVGRAFMAMTLGCARCHDHMTDPISTEDYYALAGVFFSTKTVEHSNVSKWLMADLPPITREEKMAVEAEASYKKRFAAAKLAIANAEDELAALKDGSSVGGIVVDDSDPSVKRNGEWTASTSVRNWVGEGYLHDLSAKGREQAVTFKPKLPKADRYEVLVAYSAGTNRATNVPVSVRHAGGETIVHVNQRKKPAIGGLFSKIGIFEFSEKGDASVTISNSGVKDGVVIADAVQWRPAGAVVKKKGTNDAKREALNRKIAGLHEELKKVVKAETKKPALQTMSVRDEAKVADCHVSIRGDVHSPGDLVPRGFPTALKGSRPPAIPKGSSGRLELAQWLTSGDHPLTARVMVNRIWKHLMGEGLVSTPDNFGKTGALPMNQELLDWLAIRFVGDGWSVKKLVREIMGSSAYQGVRPERRRLDAEALRDAMLLVSGQLDMAMGGATIKAGTGSEFGYTFDSNRRSVYLPVFRNQLPDIFTAFDFPDPNLVAGKRARSTLATQALYFMNHPFVIRQSGFAAKRTTADEGTSLEAWIRDAYRRTLGRHPGDRELALAENFLGQSPDLKTRAAFYQSLFACIDFRYVE